VKQVLERKVARIRAAVRLEPHDRVPHTISSGFWPVGMQKKYTMQQAFYDIDVLGECYRGALSRWNRWDALSATLYSLGPMLDATGSKRYAVPGRDLAPDADFQNPDLSLMGADEYPKLIRDPMKFLTEEIVPRLCTRIGSGDPASAGIAMAKAALFYADWKAKARSHASRWASEFGVPRLTQGSSLYNPVDLIADKLRGFRRGLIDIQQRPEEVAEACEALLPITLGVGFALAPEGEDFPLFFNPQHVSPFIGPKQYEKVYWPTLKKMVDAYVARGHSVWVFFEGNQEQHLERMQDLPTGRIVAQLETTDLAKAKKALGGRICIAGGMPCALLAKGTPEQVREQTRSVLELFEGDPGFIMTSTMSLTTNVRPENLDAWIEAMEEYGYRGEVCGVETPRGEERQEPRGAQPPNALATKPLSDWESVRRDLGTIKGDAGIVREKWEEMDRATLSFLYWLIK
jgi:hypothetical protein